MQHERQEIIALSPHPQFLSFPSALTAPFLPFSCREQPIFSTRAHVFQIDPATKRNWIPASKHALTVSYFYDATRNVYRIISVGGTKAIINSTITPNMTFTKTSQKFGQWADSRANTVYGLGFASEQHLSQFAEKFQEVKEAARLAREKSQDKTELTNPALNITSHQVTLGKVPFRPIPTPFSSPITEYVAVDNVSNKTVWSIFGCYRFQLDSQGLNAPEYEISAPSLPQFPHLVLKVAELESQGAHDSSSENNKEELNQTLEELELLIKAKDEELEARNAELERRLHLAEQTLAETLAEREKIQNEVTKVAEIMDVKIFELSEIRQGLAKLVESN
ncbi:hypothetical protein llap_15016 [Limosa lapponica baueri]|uniref:WH1 domain-containing protein n=1 Tax=Limosa lapponica baueri TaxID=1758121 RepID=A0A2I0TLJ0_LIMLA|nr:hypothetical protein llap_15016 [Limosa lapponica baueri]